MRSYLSAAAFAALALAAAPALAQPPQSPPEVGLPMLAMTVVPPSTEARLSVFSPAFGNNGDIPYENTSWRGNVFPGLTWTGPVPAKTQSFVIIMQDTDGLVQGQPVLHWTMYNIPRNVTVLPPGMTAPPAGASNGPNIRGPNQFYAGPRTPAGPKHRYHFQVFALDTTIPVNPAMTYAELLAAMKGHILANGQTIGLGSMDPQAAAAAPPAGGGGGARPPG